MTASSDENFLARARTELHSSTLGDVLIALGYRHQFLPPWIKPLRDDMILVGRAMPVLGADYPTWDDETGHTELGRKPFGLSDEAVDALRAGEVYIATGGTRSCSMWGDVLATRAQALGCVGAVLDGYTRDSRGILKLDFPVFARGSYGQGRLYESKVVDFRVSIEIGGVRVSPGDIVFGDADGVVIIPRAAEREAIERALKKARAEDEVLMMVKKGMSAAEARAKLRSM